MLIAIRAGGELLLLQPAQKILSAAGLLPFAQRIALNQTRQILTMATFKSLEQRQPS